jgi:opacity protein-like surface antigen
MLKFILKFLFILIQVIPAAFADADADTDADDTLSSFNKQGDELKYPKPSAEESFFAMRAPMEVTLRRYFGLNAGANFVTLKPTIADSSTRGTDSQSLSSNSPRLSWGANAYGGIGANFDHFYIGAELSGGYNTLKYDQITTKFCQNPQTTVTFKQPLNLGFDLMPGYITSQKDFLFYGRLGLATSLFNIKINNNSNSSVNKFLVGWRAGLGMEYFISEAFSTRFEYVFTSYHNVNQTYVSNDPWRNIYSYKITSPHTQQINLGLTINF